MVVAWRYGSRPKVSAQGVGSEFMPSGHGAFLLV